MTHKIFAKAFVLLAMFSVLACVDQQRDVAPPADEVRVINERVVFSSWQSFREIQDKLSYLSSDEQLKWARGLSHKSMIDNKEMGDGNEYIIFSPIQKLFLNEDGLVQIENDVILYRKGIQYYMNVDEYDALTDPEDITKSERRGEFGMMGTATTQTDESGRAFVAYVNNGGFLGTGGDQFEFLLTDGSQRKFVTEFIGYYSQGGSGGATCPSGGPWFAGDWYCTLYMDLKLEGRTRSSRPWSLAPDTRSASWDLDFTNLALSGYTACNVPTSFPQPSTYPVGSITNFNGGIARIIIKSASVISYNHPSAWTGDVAGTVTHQYAIPGDQNYHSFPRFW